MEKLDDLPPVTFALGMSSAYGGPAFPVLYFDDGAAVALHAVRALATDLNIPLPHASVGDILRDWDRAFAALAELAQVLAYDDKARGHRGEFVPEDLLTPALLLQDARQIFRLKGDKRLVLPVSVQAAAAGSIKLDQTMMAARPNVCLAAVLGRECHAVDERAARSAIAGWTLVTELCGQDGNCLNSPGAVILGPLLVPAVFAGELNDISYALALMGQQVAQGTLEAFAMNAGQSIAGLSHECLLLPGDVVILGPGPANGDIKAGAVDTIEAYASGFGVQRIALQ